jgi:RHS repeat-associated protein
MTGFKYISQRHAAGAQSGAEAGLYFYNARYYDPELGRFIQADKIIPNPGNPLAWNRYAYANNNPLYYTDPSGHSATVGEGGYDDEHKNQAEEDAQRNRQLNCQAGNSMYCSYAQNHPVEYATSMAVGLVGAGTASTVVTNISVPAIIHTLESVLSTGGFLCSDGDCTNEVRTVKDVVLNPRAIGRYGEFVSQIEKNTRHIESITGTAKYRIPDMLVKADAALNIQGILTEVKNVAVLRVTPQLLDFALYSSQNGYQFNIIARSSTILPPSTMNFISQFGINLINSTLP